MPAETLTPAVTPNIPFKDAEAFARCVVYATRFVRQFGKAVTIYFRNTNGEYFWDEFATHGEDDIALLTITRESIAGILPFGKEDPEPPKAPKGVKESPWVY